MALGRVYDCNAGRRGAYDGLGHDASRQSAQRKLTCARRREGCIDRSAPESLPTLALSQLWHPAC